MRSRWKYLTVISVLVLSVMLFGCHGKNGGTSSGGHATITSIRLPKTGQTTSYATGDDGDLQKGVAWPAPRFTDNADGTITDNLVGLMWLKDANCINTQYASFDNDNTAGDGAVTWQHALDFVAGINAGTYSNCGGGHTDWRLPNRKELRSLIDKSNYNPALPGGYPFANVRSSFYWSSTTIYDASTGDAWSVYMPTGTMGFSDKVSSTIYVWPVRDATSPATISLPKTGQTESFSAGDDGDLQKGVAWPDPRFTVASRGTGTVVKDNLTGLMWAGDAGTPTVNGISTCTGGMLTWQQSLDYVACLNAINYLGYSDWRLPNDIEIESLMDFSAYNPAIPKDHPFANVQSVYWVSSMGAGYSGSYAWDAEMLYGNIAMALITSSNNVWPVRGGQ